ncbi:MAG TPA: hypothetical protein VEH00_14045 [Steroidobacteraceae bacterium]|nr:hypothetical protein [Steroidobacteraceae bacterium]
MKLLIAMGVLMAANLCLIAYLLTRTPRLNKPLTSADTLKAAPIFRADAVRHPRLSSRGKWIVVMAAAFGTVATACSLALGWRIATTGLTPVALPAMVMILIFDLVPAGFVVLLYRTYRFLLTGELTTGIVVAATIRPVTSWGLIYDFLDSSGRVVRGSSRRSFYTVALARCFDGAGAGDYFGVGSHVPVLYRADDSSRNALYVSWPWVLKETA